jgi:glycerol-3-phosphate dehydrogenase
MSSDESSFGSNLDATAPFIDTASSDAICDEEPVEEFDLIVIGGGIIGCGIARDASLRGLRVVVVEKEDFSSGTSSRSTRLIHGGLRYLAMFDFGLVRQDLREREILLKTAPHRVRPLQFTVPFYNRSLWYRLRLRIGLLLYDLLSFGKSLPNHSFFSPAETLRREPELAPEGLQGAAVYWDAQSPFVERLCLDNLVDAVRHGATAYNHTEVTGLPRDGSGRVCGVRVRDSLAGQERTLHARVVVDATGPWLDRFENRVGTAQSRRLRLTKGIHFATPKCVDSALVLFAGRDERLFFVIPWLDSAWVGTTDTDFDDNLDTVRATGEDVRYLLETVSVLLPRAEWDRIHFTSAGVRALVRRGQSGSAESDVSRKHRVVIHSAADGAEGLISVLGGKITAYRGIAEEVTDNAVRLLGSPAAARYAACATAARTLPGGEIPKGEALLCAVRADSEPLGLTEEQADRLALLYGSEYTEILALIRAHPELGSPLGPDYPEVRACVRYAVQQEFARTLSDVMMRRTALSFSPDQGLSAVGEVVQEMAGLLFWDAERIADEIEHYRYQVQLTQAFRAEMGVL